MLFNGQHAAVVICPRRKNCSSGETTAEATRERSERRADKLTQGSKGREEEFMYIQETI